MANTNAPFGFSLSRRLDGAAPNYAEVTRQILYTNTSVMATGDVVIEDVNGDGYITLAATTDNPILGIFDGCEYYDTVIKQKIWSPIWNAPTTALAGSVVAKVIVDNKAVFNVQSNLANLGVSSIGANATFILGTPTIAGISTESLSTSTNTTNTLPFRIVGIASRAGIDPAGSYNVVEVVMNTQTYSQTTGV